jgi:hypothetical protein
MRRGCLTVAALAVLTVGWVVAANWTRTLMTLDAAWVTWNHGIVQ